jgi:uncharacterized membrane protein
MTHFAYQAFLRISALTLALVLLFVSGIFSPITQQLSQSTGSYLASAIGVHTSVVPSELDTSSAHQDNKVSQKASVGSSQDFFKKSNEIPTYILSIILFIILVLIILNYVLDYFRGRQPSVAKVKLEITKTKK